MSDKKTGYKNPPAHAQYAKGQSGNPAGRPKSSGKIRNESHLMKLLIKTFNRGVKVNLEGNDADIPSVEAVLLRLSSDAMKGNNQAIKLYLSLLHKAYAKQTEQIQDLITLQHQVATVHDKMPKGHPLLEFLNPQDLIEYFDSLGQAIQDVQNIDE